MFGGGGGGGAGRLGKFRRPEISVCCLAWLFQKKRVVAVSCGLCAYSDEYCNLSEVHGRTCKASPSNCLINQALGNSGQNDWLSTKAVFSLFFGNKILPGDVEVN